MAKVGPKEQQRRSLRERQKRPQQRVKPASCPNQSRGPEATPAEILRLLKQRDKRRAKARVYQRGYYKKHRDQILQQRKERAEKLT